MPNRLLIIERDEALRDILYHFFAQSSHYQVKVQSPAAFHPDALTSPLPQVILMDHSLVANGIAMCRQLKASKATDAIPVILFSVLGDKEEEARAAGASAFIEKPFLLEHLLATIERQLPPAAPLNADAAQKHSLQMS